MRNRAGEEISKAIVCSAVVIVLPSGAFHHYDAANRRGVDVDVVNADTGTSDHAHRASSEQIGGDFRLAAHNQTIAVFQCLRQF